MVPKNAALTLCAIVALATAPGLAKPTPVGATAPVRSLLTLRVEPTFVKARLGEPIRVFCVVQNNSTQAIAWKAPELGHGAEPCSFRMWDEQRQRGVQQKLRAISLAYLVTLRLDAKSGARFPYVVGDHYVIDQTGTYTFAASMDLKPVPDSGAIWGDSPIPLASNSVKIEILP